MRRSDLSTLERHLRLRPDDWNAWRVYGDCLTDQDDGRGRLIALILDRGGPENTSERRAATWREVATFTRRNSARWLSGLSLPEWTEIGWHFGFISAVRFRSGPAEAALRLIEHPAGRFLSHLSWEKLPLTTDDLQTIARRELLDRLDGLSLDGVGATDDGACLFAEGALSSLTKLDLPNNRIGALGAMALADGVGTDVLTRLDLSGNPVGDDGILAFARSNKLAELRELHLANTQISDIGCVPLVREALSEDLEILNLRDNPVSNATASAITRAGLRSLTALDVSGTELDRLGVYRIGGSERLPALKTFLFHGVWIGEAGMVSSFLWNLRRSKINYRGPLFDAKEIPMATRLSWTTVR